MLYQVWTANDLFVMVFKEATDGSVIGIADENDPNPYTDTPVFTYCIAETVSIGGSAQTDRRPVTGRVFKKLVPQVGEYTCSIDYMYIKKDELTKDGILGRNVFTSIYFLLLNYIRQPSTQKEWHRIKRSLFTQFEVRAKENDFVKCSASLMAEEYIIG